MGERSRAALERLDDGPIYTVYLDAGAFSWLREIVESKQRYQRSFEGYQRLVKRTLLSFDEAQRALDTDRPTKKVLPRPKKPAPRSRKR